MANTQSFLMRITSAFDASILFVSLRIRYFLLLILVVVFSSELFVLFAKPSVQITTQIDLLANLKLFMPGQRVSKLDDYPCLSELIEPAAMRPVSCQITLDEETSITVTAWKGIIQRLDIQQADWNFDTLLNYWGFPDTLDRIPKGLLKDWPEGAVSMIWKQQHIHAMLAPLMSGHVWNQDTLIKELYITY